MSISKTYFLAAVLGLSITTLSFAWSDDVESASQTTIRGVIVDSHGMPIPGATVLLNGYEGPLLDPLGPSATTDKAGGYNLQLELKKPMTVKEIWVSHPGFVRITHTNRFLLKSRQDVSLDFKLEPGEVISGIVKPSRLFCDAADYRRRIQPDPCYGTRWPFRAVCATGRIRD